MVIFGNLPASVIHLKAVDHWDSNQVDIGFNKNTIWLIESCNKATKLKYSNIHSIVSKMEQDKGNLSIVDTEKASIQVILENRYYILSCIWVSSCRKDQF